MHEKRCVNKCYLSAASPGLSELARPRQGAEGFNWHMSYLDAAELLSSSQSTSCGTLFVNQFLDNSEIQRVHTASRDFVKFFSGGI